VEQTRKLLEQIGLPGQRLQMINISSAMAGQFAFAAAELTAEVQRLGPSPVRTGARRAAPAGTNGPLRPGGLPAEVIEQEEAAEG
jgi:hypothetical protein